MDMELERMSIAINVVIHNFFALQVSKAAESLALPFALTLMAPHLAHIQQCSPLKLSTAQKSAPRQNTQEVSENINHYC